MVMKAASPRESINKVFERVGVYRFGGGKRCRYAVEYGEEDGTMEMQQIGSERTKNVLILMSDTGGGHRASAEAIRDAFTHEYGDQYRVFVKDVWKEYTGWPLNDMERQYKFMVKHVQLWSLAFHSTSPKWIHSVYLAAIAAFYAKEVEAGLMEYKPDIIISVHPLMQHIPLWVLKWQNLQKKVIFVTVITDLNTCHRTWFHPSVNRLYCPSEEVAKRALLDGLQDSQIRVFGLPIRPSFVQALLSKDDLRTELEMDPQLPAVLLMGGGEGMGPVKKTAKALGESLFDKELQKPIGQLIIICGRNETLASTLQMLDWKIPVKIRGFEKQMQKWMGACDCIITKAGPGTIAEALISGLPIILNDYIPGQEKGNVPFVVENGAGVFTRSPKETARIVAEWFGMTKDELNRMSRNALKLAQPNAVFHIVRDIHELAFQRGLSKGAKMLVKLLLSSFVLLSCTCNANAGVTSTFVRTEWPSVDIPLDNEVFAVPKGYNAPQQVHITQGDYDGKAVIISWVTADEPGSNKVRFGLSEGKLDLTAEGTVHNYTFYNYKSGYIHQCLIDGLQYDTKYYYEIGDGDSSRRFWFRTPLPIDPDAPQKFGIIGDLGQTYNSLSTLEHSLQTGADTILFVGDLSYADRYQYNDVGVRWDSWGRFAERSAAYQPWIWSAGNHEIEYFPYMGEVIPFRNYIQRYPTPYLASKSSSPLWYSVRRASAHIIVLSSYSPFVKYTPQWEWLNEEFKKVDREKTPWLIVLMHAPIYNTNNAHFMEGESMRVAFESWFCLYKVDIIFAGHVHAYERSYRISSINPNVSSASFYPVPDKSAPVYVTVGDGGNQEGLAQRFRDPQPDFSAFREASYGHSTLEIKNRTHAIYHWNRNDDGKRIPTDSFVLLNQYWGQNRRRRKLKKNHLHSVLSNLQLSLVV